VIPRLRSIGTHKYRMCSIWSVLDVCTDAFSIYPAEASSHPEMAVPILAPTFIPKEVQAYILPSILLSCFRKVYSEQDAIRAFISPCRGLVPRAVIPVKRSIMGILPV
jgi:hypothetical protein